ncbi:MAG: alpha/beta hydrolase [Alphaproteobacteria bacterium]|nr:alpha/beta hydrolase [Alphaproteobacteria bacterium]
MSEQQEGSTINHTNSIFTFRDDDFVLYNQVQVCSTIPKNVLLLSGIPGLSSEYFLPLAHMLQLPTNVWRVDLPDNGNNLKRKFKNFDGWFNLFLETIQRFDRPILISHSFGGMIPLMLPQTEKLLSGIILLNTASSLPKNPDFEIKSFLDGYAFNQKAALWFQKKIIETNYKAQWIPQTLPTLILGAKKDTIVPFNPFRKDSLFQRENITIKTVPNSGHFCWLDNPLFVRKMVYSFLSDLFELEGF